MPPLGRIDERILVLAPTGRDALLTGEILADAGFSPHTCRDVEEICRELDAGAAVALLAEEALGDPVRKRLIRVLARQEPWSDLPLVIFTVGEAVAHDALEILGNVTLLERPVRVTTLVTTVRTALGARRRQYQVRDLLRRLEEADRRKDEFLAMLGHELRNPLSAVSNALHLLGLRAGSDPSLQRMHDVLQRQTRNMTRLVDDLLDVSRITRGKIELRKEPMDLGAIVERAVRGMRPFIDARGHELSVSLPPEPITVQVDPTRLEQVITNLLHNAAKYTEPGGRISLTAGREGDDAVLRVRDTGVGIAPDLLARVFDLFTQAERSLDRSQGGLGVGLTLVRRLVEMHGGKVRASSAGPGTGSEFEVRLPLEKAAPGSRLQAPGESNSFPTWSLEPGARSPEPRALTSAKRILVVEDNVDAAHTLAEVLEMWGHTVRVAHDGTTALAEAAASGPEVVLLDIGLPGIDGYEVARRLRHQGGSAHIMLVALTGYGQDEDRRRAQEAGFDHHLTKPLDPAQLQQLLAE